MNVALTENKNGTWTATGDAVRFHVAGSTPAEAMRKAADFLEEMEAILSGEKDEGLARDGRIE